ncbi:hypothetical protein JHN59_31075 [Streptomyces sp. MBT49]|uniref:hypothetical protein n=1 Tax=Streptomyces TaxID=1883 RepID=UPI00190A89AC|nr:hypothetical protein [Streptomyces sp. MBT49]MBK3629186.1 hypothetical protein [Streptomyces sp. MBT49]
MAELPEIVDRHILEGRAILAVKEIREARKCPLAEAVDLYRRRYEELHPEPPPARKSPGPRVLRFDRNGSLVVFEDPRDGG